MRRSRSLILLAVVLLLAVAAFGCGGNNQAPAGSGSGGTGSSPDGGGGSTGATETVKVGVLVPLEGSGYQGGMDTERATKIAIDWINEQGLLPGVQVEVVVRDSKGDVQTAARAAQELVDREGVVAIFGGGSSAEDLAISAVVKSAQVPFLPAMGNTETFVVEQGHDYAFLMAPSSGMEARAFGVFAAEQGWRKFHALAPDYEWGQTMTELFAKTLDSLDIDYDLQTTWFKLGETDFSRYITQLSASDADALLIYAWGADNIAFTKQAAQYGLFDQGKPVAGFWMFDALLPLGDEAPEGIIGFERAPFTYLMDNHEPAKKLVDEFHAQTGNYPSGYALMAYDAVLAWEAAVKKAGTTDPVEVAKALRGITFTGTRGETTMREVDGQASVPVYFGTVAFDEELGIPTFVDVVEVPAESVWLSPEEVEARRQQ